MTRWQHKAYRLRRWVLIAGIVYVVLALGWMVGPHLNDRFNTPDLELMGLLGTPLAPGFVADEEWYYAINTVLIVGLLLLAQWAFLRPGKGFTVRITQEGRPLKTAVVSAAVMAMLLTTGGIALLMELPDWWAPLMDPDHGRGNYIFLVWTGMLIIWIVWAWIFFIYWRQGDRYSQLGKMIRALVVGSILEAFIAVPVHVWATRQRECYCCRGTYTTLVLAGTVLLWAFGPGIILLYWRERYRRQRLLPSCENCGYDLRGTVTAGRNECPECGAPIGEINSDQTPAPRP